MLSHSVVITVGLSGLAIAIVLLSMIQLGSKHFNDEQVGNTIAFTTFAFCLIAAAVECRSETATP